MRESELESWNVASHIICGKAKHVVAKVEKMAASCINIVPNSASKSVVWEHFGFPGNEDGTVANKNVAVCRICKAEMPFKNNTTNLFTHLERHHKDVHSKLCRSSRESTSAKQPKQSTLQENVNALQPLSTTSARYKQMVNAIGNFIAKDMLPLAVVEGEGFCKLMYAADPRFNVPSCTQFHRKFSQPSIWK